MFERYTEKARRVIFFARYEASLSGSAEITTEHILLALFREAPALMKQFVPRAKAKAIRHEIEEHAPIGRRVPTSVDLPLSIHCKRVLPFAAEEAERLGHKQIGSEHLLLALAREKKCLAAGILRRCGFDLAQARQEIGRMTPASIEDEGHVSFIRRAEGWGDRFHWEKRSCEPHDALKHRESRRLFLYVGGGYDQVRFDLVKGGWTDFHCAICWRNLFFPDDPERRVGYTNGQEWLCPRCYTAFAAPGS